jgi:hypothetical protein
MVKTTIYLPRELKRSLERAAEFVREAIRAAVSRRRRPRPRVPLAHRGLGDPTVAERVDELLRGFGRQ